MAGKPQKRKPSKLSVVLKRQKILALHEQGATITQISQHLKDQGLSGVSRGMVHLHLSAILEEESTTLRLKARHFIQLELNKLSKQELSIAGNAVRLAEIDTEIIKKLSTAVKADDWLTAKNLIGALNADGVEKYSRSLERIWKRRDAIMGTHKPQKVELSARESLAKLLGKKAEDIPDVES
jgi:hypothetical protein